MEFRVRRTGLTIALLAALAVAAPAMGEPLGNLRGITAAPGKDGSPGWTLSTDNGVALRVDLLGADVLRVQAGRNGTLRPAGDKATRNFPLSGSNRHCWTVVAPG